MSAGRLTFRLVLSAVAGAMALSSIACGGGGSSSSDASASYLAAVTRAAYATDQVPGYKFSLTASTQFAGKSAEVTGSGTINERGSEGAARVQADGKTIEEVIAKPYFYISVPTGSGMSLTHGKPWVRADLSTLTQSVGSSSVGAGSSNPSEVLSYLRAAGAVTRVGEEQVRGVASTHYHALIELARLASAVPAGQQAAARKAGKLLERLTGAKALPMDVWIGAGRVDRIDLAYTVCTPEGRLQLTLSIDLYDYGRQPVVSPPPASQVTDIGAKLESQVAKALAQAGCH